MKKSRLLPVIILPALLVILMSNLFTSSLSPYLTVSEVVTKKQYDRSVQVMAKPVNGSVSFDRDSGVLMFQVTDGAAVLSVRHEGLVSNLGEATDVVVIGRYGRDGVFYAERVLVRCPSKYVESEQGGG